MQLGVCYYPEHWPEAWWAEDAAAMAAMGLAYVRIGEFAWSRIEPEFNRFAFEWLDRAIDTLGAAGLKVVLGTPTATPPKWLVDAHPDILPVDRHGRRRGFGSRRHYCFSSPRYRHETARIVQTLAGRYGAHPHVAAWQTDNEYGCHDTVVSYSADARTAFRVWLRARYGTIAALNAAWGTVFWSQAYLRFEDIDPPVEAVTAANPAHLLDYQRFASDEVVAYNRLQVDILRALSPGKPILHNYMGAFTSFDHHAVGADLDAASWDSYPLGFLEMGPWDGPTKEHYLRQGHPDFTAFHHDLYRGVGRGRWWVMEQQPGPVNWAPFNPAPIPGMVRAWTLEAFAHGAEVVSYFRWRQAPFAQEQMHAGLHTPDRSEAPAAAEVRMVAAELARLGPVPTTKAQVALVFDYTADWAITALPQGKNFSYPELVAAFYGASRRCGWDIDVISPADAVDGYQLILVPCLPIVPDGFVERLAASGAAVVFGPRSGSKTEALSIPDTLPPGPLQTHLNLKVSLVESLRPGVAEPAGRYTVTRWLEHIDSPALPRVVTERGQGLWYTSGRWHYLSTWPCPTLLRDVLTDIATGSGLPMLDLPLDLRLRRRGPVHVAVNYGPETLCLTDHLPGAAGFDYVMGGVELSPAGVSIWRIAGAQ